MTSNTQSFHDQVQNTALARFARIDPPRNEPMVRLRVVCKPEIHALCGKLLKRGENVITVYQSQVKYFTDQVEQIPRSRRLDAKEIYADELAAWEKKGGTEEDFPGSIEAILLRMPSRRVKRGPFTKVEILEGVATRADRIAQLKEELALLEASAPAPAEPDSNDEDLDDERDEASLQDLHVSQAQALIRVETDEATLEGWLNEEDRRPRPRSTVMSAIRSRLEELKEDDDEEDDELDDDDDLDDETILDEG